VTACTHSWSARGVDELRVVTSTHDGADRLRSYELLAAADVIGHGRYASVS
jgi:hypothetical protein